MSDHRESFSSLHQPVSSPHFLVSADGSIHGEDTPENRELVRRWQACLQACEGLSTEELEQGIIQEMRRVIAEVIPVLEEKKELEAQLAAERAQPTIPSIYVAQAGFTKGM